MKKKWLIGLSSILGLLLVTIVLFHTYEQKIRIRLRMKSVPPIRKKLILKLRLPFICMAMVLAFIQLLG